MSMQSPPFVQAPKLQTTLPVLDIESPSSRFKRADTPDKLFQLEHCPLDPGLCIGVVILDAIQKFTQRPVGIGFHPKHDLL